MKQNLLILLSLFLYFFSLGQNNFDELKDQANTSYEKGIILYKDKNYTSALEHFKQADEFNNSIPNLFTADDSIQLKHKINSTKFKIGRILYKEGDFKKSRPFLEESFFEFDISQSNNKNRNSSYLFRIVYLIRLENSIGHYYQGEKYINKGNNLINNHEIIPQVLYRYYNDSGDLYRNLKKYDSAKSMADSALIYINKYPAATNNLFANIYDDQKKYAKAIKLHKENIRYYKIEKDSFEFARVYSNISISYRKNKNYPLAILTADSSRIIFHQLKDSIGLADACNNLADAFRDKNQLDSALHYAHQSLILGIKNFNDENILSTPDFSDLKQTENLEPVLEYLKTKASIFQKKHQFSKNRKNQKHLYKTLNSWSVAHELFLSNALNSDDKILWNGTSKNMYEDLISLAFDINDDALAFEFFEKSRSVILRDQLQKNNIIRNSKIPRDSLFNWMKNKKGEKIIKEQYPKVYELLKVSNIPTIFEIQNNISKDQTFIEYFSGHEFIYAFAISKAKFKLFKLKKSYKNNIKEFQNIIQNGQTIVGNGYELGNEIHQQIFKPILKEFKSKRFIIVSDDDLYGLHFGSLYDSTTEKHLIEDYAFSYNYSGQMLLNTQIIEKNDKLTAFAPIHFVNQPSLELSKSEILEISIGYELDTFFEEQSTKQNFIKNAPFSNQLYISSHGNLYPEPYINFYNGEQLNNLDIYQLDLSRVDMVGLSACRTSNGEVIKGEGILSMARAFIFSGVNRVIAPQSNIREVYAKMIFGDFYPQFRNGTEADVALQNAKIKMIRSGYDHIGQWSQIIVVGKVGYVDDGALALWFWLGGVFLLASFTFYYFRNS